MFLLSLKYLGHKFCHFTNFKPIDAKLILQNAVDSKADIAIFEGQERSFPSILAMLVSPITVLLTIPFIRPFKLGRIIFTYLISNCSSICSLGRNSIIFTDLFCKRNGKSNNRFNRIEKYDWKVGKVKSGPSKLLYLIGTEKNRNTCYNST